MDSIYARANSRGEILVPAWTHTRERRGMRWAYCHRERLMRSMPSVAFRHARAVAVSTPLTCQTRARAGASDELPNIGRRHYAC